MTKSWLMTGYDECADDFCTYVMAPTREVAWREAREQYPECNFTGCQSVEEVRRYRDARYEHISRGGDYDDDGRPIYPGGYQFPDDDDY